MFEKNKGGRPLVKHKKDQQLSTQVTLLERKIIEAKSKKTNMTTSEYLRLQALNGEVKVKSLPKEVLQIIGTLNHNCANINQIAHQLNGKNLLTHTENLRLSELIDQNKDVVKTIKKSLKNDW